jgi:hypothetical protein
MKIIIGLLLVCSIYLVSVPVDASSFGLSPAVINVQFYRGNSSTFYFTVSSYSGLVEISSEGMPVTVSPSSVTVVAGTPISVIVGCNSDAISGVYDGRIKFLAKSGDNVLSGINVICNLTVLGSSDNITLTTNVVGNGSGGGFDSGGSYPNGTPDWTKMFPSMLATEQQSSSGYIPPVQQPIAIPPVVGNPPQNIAPAVAVQEQASPELDKAVWAGIAFWAIVAGLFVWGLSWLVDRRRKKEPAQ